ncbi:hypothetical protein V2J09_002938 [Rumex salicifolius]
MQKLGFRNMKSLERLKSFQVPAPKAAESLPPASTRLWSDSSTSGSFAGLKIAAEKMVREHALVRTELDLANSKLKKSLDHIMMLEEKLQAAFNENSQLKVKYQIHQNLWQDLESKFSATNALCGQLSETIKALACQVENVETDKQLIEEKLSSNSAALDTLNDQLSNLSLKLDSADETIKDREKELKELKFEKQEREAFYQDQQCRSAKVMENKDAMIKSLEADVMTYKMDIDSLKSNLENAHKELKQKEKDVTQMKVSLEKLERENSNICSSNHELSDNLSRSLVEIQSLEDTANAFSTALTELDKQSIAMEDMATKLFSVCDTFCMLCKHEKMLVSKLAKQKHDQLYQEYLHMKSEKDELQSANQKLNDKVYELQRTEESLLVQHAEECQSTEEQIRKLESEVEALTLKKNANVKLIKELEEKAENLSGSLRSSQDKTKELLLRLSELELESKEKEDKLEADVQKNTDEIVALQTDLGKSSEQVDSLEKKVNQLCNDLKEKEQLIMEFNEREKCLENQKAEIQTLLVTAESKFSDAKKQYDSMLDNKQLELSKHLKEISQRNDQAITDIRNKFELEKQEFLSLEKEKADKAVADMERSCEQRLDQCKKESELHLTRIQEEQSVMLKRIQEEHEKKELSLKSNHGEELKRIQLQVENELREKIKIIRNEHEEERQKALLQMQWRVMSDRPQENQEVDSEKENSVSSVRMREPVIRKRRMQAPKVRSKADAKDSPYPAEQSPMSTLLRNVEKEHSGMMDMSNHSKKVTRREYEVETNNAGKITKRRKTRTVMFGEPRRHKKAGIPGVVHTQPSNIGDLFTEGSLNPYVADDPYAFD